MSVGSARHGLRGITSLTVMLALPLACSACSGARTSVTQVWQAPLPSPTPMKRVIVFGARMDEASRRVVEDGFVAELAKRDVKALRSYEVFPGAPPPQDKARARVKELGIDGILVANLKNVSEKITYTPGYAGGFWSSYYGPNWWGGPGYVITDQIVTFETTLWDARTEDKLVWAALTKTTNPATGRNFIDSLVKAVIPHLEEAHLIPR